MLTRKGVHLRPVPKRRCPAGRQTSAAQTGQLAPSVTAWLAASGSAREAFAAEHFALAGGRPHHTCQVCQEAIRARLQRRSLQARQAAPEEDTHATPESGVHPAPPAPATLAKSTPAFAPTDSSVWPPSSPPAANTIPASVTPSDATLPGGAPPRTYWADVGRAAWETYWDLRSESASRHSSHQGSTL